MLPAVTLAALAVTCDSPTAVRRTLSVSMTPRFRSAGFTAFAGLAVDSVRATITRPPDQVLATQTLAFSPDSTTLSTSLSVTISGAHEQLLLQLDFLSGSVVMFTGQDTVDVVGGISTEAAPIPMTFVGPGRNIASLHVTPRDSGALFGSQSHFGVTALDSSSSPVSQFYVSWATSSATDTVNAAGTFRAGSTRNWVWVRAVTPTGIRDSARIMVQPAPSAVQAVSGASQSAIAHTGLSLPLVARVIGPDNQPEVGVLVTFGAPAGGSVSPASGVTDTLGQMSTVATLGTAIGTQTFTASAAGATTANFAETATAGVATKLAFTTQPSTTAAGAAITPAVVVTAQDSAGNTATTFTGTVALGFGANPGSAAINGTTSVAAVAGVATFTNLSLNFAGSPYTLVATSGALPPDTSAAFTITAGTAATLALVSGNNQNGAPNALLSAPIVVKVTDAFGNPVPNRAVAFAVTAGGGSVGTPAATTNAQGQASSTWTLGTSGTQTVSVTSTGLAGSPITVSATVTGVASTTVTPHLDTLKSLGDTITLKAQAKDFTGANVSGTFTWTTADSTIATVSAAGLVTAVKNGNVLITAKEAGGTQDTARIVVQQQVATVNVTPGNRSIYLTRTYQFSATAVDGRGHPIAGYGPYLWSSTAPAVATVDTTGFVTGVGLGNAQIKATAGTITGVANVAILTPITRIVVEVAGGPGTTDTFTMTSLGLTRSYQAIAHDTLDNVMSGVSFTWASTNPSVASLDSITTTTARATAQANGVTAINASAQGVTSNPGASLTVSQVLASIVLSPSPTNPTATIGVGGTTALTARGKDANGFFVAGGLYTYRYASSNPAVATVDSVTGIVTGVNLGADTITAHSGAVTSNILTVTVGNSVPAVISFGRDTLSVGRGSSTSIPVLLSKADSVPVIVKLGINAFGHWGSVAVTIPAGQTSANATLFGDSAGTATATATDSSGTGYTAGSAAVKVTANMRLTNTGYAINATDVVTTQVLLSDPSPAGGTYVTFSYGTAGVASVSPNPAFIPQGQLAADIQIQGLSAGTTTITPVAAGVNGVASNFTAYAPTLTMTSPGGIRLGAGQYDAGQYVYVPTNNNTPIAVALTSTDTTLVAVTPTVTIPSGYNYAYFTTQALTPGTATVTPSAPGWTSVNAMPVVVTTPHVGICCGTTLNTTNPAINVTLYSEDSTNSAHNRINTLVVRVSSSNDSIMHVIDTVVTIQPGSYYTYARVIPGATAVGTAYVIASAPGHTPDSTAYTTIGPKLAFSFSTMLLGAGQYDQNQYVYTPNSVTAALPVSVANTNPAAVTVPAVDTVPVGYNYRYYLTQASTPGLAALVATAPGYTPSDTSRVISTTPMVTACCGTTLNNFGPGASLTVYSTDTVRSAHNRLSPLVVTINNLTPTKISIDSSAVTIDSGYYYNNRAHFVPLDTGTAKITFTAPGHLVPDTLTYQIVVPKVQLSFFSTQIGRRQHFDPNNNGFYVYTPDTRRSPLAVTITHNGAIDSLTATALTIDSATNYKYLDAYGLANGTDTLVISAAGYLPDTAYLIVSSPRLTSCCMPGNLTTTNPPFTMTLYATDSVGNAHYAMDNIAVNAVPSDSNVIRPVSRTSHLPANSYYTYDTVTVVGPGTASLTFSDSAGVYGPATTSNLTVTGPSLSLANAATMLGMRQSDNNGSYVYVPNAVATPLVVHLTSTAPTVATATDSVTIPAGQSYAYFTVTAHDTIGTMQIQATALGYSPTSMNVQVTHPKFTISTNTSVWTTSGRSGFTVYATDQNGSSHVVTDTVIVHLLSSATSVASFDSNTVTILPGQYYNNLAGWYPNPNQATPGTAQLTVTDSTAAFYQYTAGSVNVQVSTPSLGLTWSNNTLGIGQYFEPYVYTPNNQAQPDSVAFAHTGTPHVTTAAYQTNTPVSFVTIPSASSYAYFRVIGASRGTDTLVASLATPLHNPATAFTAVDSGRVLIYNWPTSLAAGDSILLTVYAADQSSNSHNVADSTTFTLAPNANLAFATYNGTSTPGPVTTSLIMPAGAYYTYVWLKAVASGTGSAQISNSSYLTYSNTVTVP